LLTRHGATLPGIVKSAWYGGRLGFQNADRARNLQVGAHAYRLALVVGSQPELADVIFDDVAGGLPQRFLWLPTFDSGRLSADDEVEAPASLTWRPPNHVFAGEHVMMLPKEATQAILRAAEAENRPIGSASPDASLDGHALLNRAKVAALLALWDDRDHVNPEDWKLAGTVMAVSMRTRDEMRKALFAKARRGNLQRGRSEAERNAIIMDAEGERKVGVHRASQWLLSWSGWTSTPQSESAIKRRARSGLREHVGSALKVLTLSGQLVMDEDGRYSKVGP
jgi:hypothetical protein